MQEAWGARKVVCKRGGIDGQGRQGWCMQDGWCNGQG
jgi:hypothetical protein